MILTIVLAVAAFIAGIAIGAHNASTVTADVAKLQADVSALKGKLP